jgi:formyltetrahydrofolate deformylase
LHARRRGELRSGDFLTARRVVAASPLPGGEGCNLIAEMRDTAVLLIDCPDRKGLVARVSGLLYERGANILHADQHIDHELGMFFMRVEWALNGAGTQAGGFDLQEFKTAFTPLAAELKMHWSLSSTARRPRVALFCSQYLHCVADLLYRWKTGELECEIPLVVSNHQTVAELAAFYGVPFEHTPVTPGTRGEVERHQLELLMREEIELVVLARYMQILSAEFVSRYPAAVINVHHSFLPAFTGARPYHAAHERGVKLIGATSHYVTEVLDDGPIIEQDVARISHRDQVEDLVARGRDLERMVLSRAVRWHLERRILCYRNKTVVFD